MEKVSCLYRNFLPSLLFLFFMLGLEAGEPGSNSYRERFNQAPDPEREEPAAGEEEDGGDGGGGSKGGKSRKKKKKKDDVRRVVGGSHDPIVPVTGVETGDLTAVTYKSPTPTAPLLEKAWNSTTWAPTYQPASRSFLGEKGNLEAVIQSDLIKHTGWKVDGDSISVSPDLNGGPYDVETGQAITFTVDRETSVDFLGMPGRVASGLAWDNPFSVLGPNNPFLIVDRNPLKNPHGVVQVGRRLANYAGLLSAWTFGEGVQITEDGGIGIIHDPSGKQALRAGAGLALWLTPARVFRSAWSAGAQVVPGATRAFGVAAALGRGAWGQATSAARGFGHWTAGAARDLGRRTWGVMEFIARHTHSPGMSAGQVFGELYRQLVRDRLRAQLVRAINNGFPLSRVNDALVAIYSGGNRAMTASFMGGKGAENITIASDALRVFLQVFGKGDYVYVWRSGATVSFYGLKNVRAGSSLGVFNPSGTYGIWTWRWKVPSDMPSSVIARMSGLHGIVMGNLSKLRGTGTTRIADKTLLPDGTDVGGGMLFVYRGAEAALPKEVGHFMVLTMAWRSRVMKDFFQGMTGRPPPAAILPAPPSSSF